MKIKITFFILVHFFCTLCSITAQNFNAPDGGGEHLFNASKNPCLTEAQRLLVKQQIKQGIQQLDFQNRLVFETNQRSGGHPLFIWPIQKASGVVYNDVWSISGYMDHNASYPNQLTDYNCGTKTYDTAAGYNHLGVDIFTWPFSWKMMDDDDVEIIAAAPGQIIAKEGSQFDRSCTFNNNLWNAVYVQHADGSVALYGHMKQNSLTTKNVGEMVTAGEFLGIVGSSGNSTGPHLHFEVYSEIEWNGTGQDVLVDPYMGACNDMNADSWWQTQKPYTNPNINAVLTHSAPPIFPTCPTTETPNENNNFDTADTIYFGLYMRDQAAGTSINLKIRKPDNSVLYNWDYAFTDDYSASYWYWFYSGVYDVNGEWTWEATYQGQTVTHPFNITGALGLEENDFSSVSIFPNPFKDVVIIKSHNTIHKATLVDMVGKTVLIVNNTSNGIKEVNLESVSNGMYFLTLEGNDNRMKTIKVIKE
ncbi:MAG TPA: peptidoglycan DD-metalloendopeptidase family protein [Aquaticitalea sp.]|nr:peptidoglycan DD-metalloendopeptidase family protein [Aquaticitalea sp.]